jgi:hypothetical protein
MKNRIEIFAGQWKGGGLQTFGGMKNKVRTFVGR